MKIGEDAVKGFFFIQLMVCNMCRHASNELSLLLRSFFRTQQSSPLLALVQWPLSAGSRLACRICEWVWLIGGFMEQTALDFKDKVPSMDLLIENMKGDKVGGSRLRWFSLVESPGCL